LNRRTADTPMSDQWFVQFPDKTSGPFTREQLQKLCANGRVTADTLISANQREWASAATVFADREAEAGVDDGSLAVICRCPHPWSVLVKYAGMRQTCPQCGTLIVLSRPEAPPRAAPVTAIPPVLLRYVAGLQAHDVAGIAETVGDDLAFVATTGRRLDKAEFLAMLAALYAAFPDWRYDHDPPEARGDGRFAIRWRQEGTHTGTLALPDRPAVAATGRTVRIPEQDFFYTITGEQVVEIRPDPIPGGAPQGIFDQIGAGEENRGTER
jgi:hypothetical protein